MKINALTVCVQYADYLSIGLPRWLSGLDSWTIVTDGRDEATPRFAQLDPRIKVVQTDLFYADGASFNKGRAIEWARKYHLPWRDWILFLDADIVPEADWYPKVTKFD